MPLVYSVSPDVLAIQPPTDPNKTTHDIMSHMTIIYCSDRERVGSVTNLLLQELLVLMSEASVSFQFLLIILQLLVQLHTECK